MAGQESKKHTRGGKHEAEKSESEESGSGEETVSRKPTQRRAAREEKPGRHVSISDDEDTVQKTWAGLANDSAAQQQNPEFQKWQEEEADEVMDQKCIPEVPLDICVLE